MIKISDDLFNFQLTLCDGKQINIPIQSDGYINITKLCKACGKEYSHWKENKNSEDVIKAIERSLGIPRDLIIKQIRSGKNEDRGTYVHRRLGLIIAQWISAEFAVEVAKCFEELLLFGK